MAPLRGLVVATVLAFAVTGCGPPLVERARPDAASAEVAASDARSPSAATPVTPMPTRSDPFRPAAYDGWRDDIPHDFPLADGLPEASGDIDRSAEPVTARICAVEAFPIGGPHRPLDVLRAAASGPEYADAHDLRLFTDDQTAHAILVRARRVAAACPQEAHGPTWWLHSVTTTDLGEESVRIVETYETDGMTNAGANIWDVVRVGNAVLVTALAGEYLPGDTLGRGIAAQQRTIAPLVARLCVFAEAGCDP